MWRPFLHNTGRECPALLIYAKCSMNELGVTVGNGRCLGPIWPLRVSQAIGNLKPLVGDIEYPPHAIAISDKASFSEFGNSVVSCCSLSWILPTIRYVEH